MSTNLKNSCIETEWTDNLKTMLFKMYGNYPVKFIEDTQYDSDHFDCRHLYVLDKINKNSDSIGIRVGANSTLCIKNLKSMNIRAEYSYHREFNCKLENNSFLVVVPEPVRYSTHSNFNLIHSYDLKEDSNLVLVDWFVKSKKPEVNFTSKRFYRNLKVFVEDNLIISDIYDHNSEGNDLPITGTVVLIGKRVKQITKKLVSLPHFEPIQTVTSIGIKRNRGSSVDLLGMVESASFNCLVSLIDSTKNSSNALSDSCKNFTCSQVGKETDNAFLIKFQVKSLDSGYSFLNTLLSPLKNEIGMSPYFNRLNTL